MHSLFVTPPTSLFTPDELDNTIPADEYYSQERLEYELYMAHVHYFYDHPDLDPR